MQDEEQVDELRSKCESPFEIEVFDILIERGYRGDYRFSSKF